MEEEDDFGDLYDDPPPPPPVVGAGGPQKSIAAFNFYEDEAEHGEGDSKSGTAAGHPHSLSVASGMPSLFKQVESTREHIAPVGALPAVEVPLSLENTGEHDSDEDDDMLLLGYTSKLASIGSREVGNARGGQSSFSNGMTQGHIELDKGDKTTENGAASLWLGAQKDFVHAAMPKSGFPLIHDNGSGRSPEVEDLTDHSVTIPGLFNGLTNHLVTIPGLSTTLAVQSVGVGHNDGTIEDEWEEGRAMEKEQPIASRNISQAAADDDWDSDSEDDLQIVLNNDHAFIGRAENTRMGIGAGDSEDEDDDVDLVLVNGTEVVEEGEEQLLPSDAPAMVGELEGGSGVDEKGLSEKAGPGGIVNHLPSRSGYGYHGYNSPFKYVRPGAAPLYGSGGVTGQALLNRPGHPKGVIGRGAGRGLFSTSQLPTWQTQGGFEYTLPPSMTVFDIDLEAFNEKPWRHPAVDITDFFNFGFNEHTWKEYCKQLEQVRLESTMQSKIRVYESGRSEQEYDPDMPPELLAAAGVHESSDRNQSRVGESEASMPLIGRGRGHIPMIPAGRPIQVEGGFGDRRPSMDIKRQRIRDSDAIVLIDAVEEPESHLLHEINLRRNRDATKEEEEGEEMEEEEVEEEEEQQEEEEEEVEEEDAAVANMTAPSSRAPKHTWREGRGKSSVSKEARFLHVESSCLEGEAKPKSGLGTGDNIPSSSNEALIKSVVPADFGTGDAITILQREATSRPGTPGAMTVEDRRKDPGGNSDLCQGSQSNPRRVNGDGESHHRRHAIRGFAQPQRGGGSHPHDFTNIGDKLGDHVDDRLQSQQANKGVDSQGSNFRRKLPPDSPRSSSGRPRLVSPEGSQTASRDDFDAQRAARVSEYKKGSADSGESTKHGFGQEGGPQSRKHKMYLEGKETGHRDLKGGSEKMFNIPHHKHDFDMDKRANLEKPHDSRKRAKQSSVERDAMKEITRHLKGREDELDSQKKEREEEVRRREYLSKDRLHYKDAERSWTESKKRDNEEIKDRQDQRKKDHEDQKDRSERGIRHRDREVESMEWQEASRRKREEFRRKERSVERTHDSKAKPKHGSERYDHDVDLYARKKEEESWKRDRGEENSRSKLRDGSWREKEHVQRNGEHQDKHAKEKEHKGLEKTSQVGGRSKRRMEDASWHAKDESRGSEVSWHAEAQYRSSRDKRKHEEDHAKDKSRLHESRAKPPSDRESLRPSENTSTDNYRSGSRDRGSGKHSRTSDERRVPSDKDRSDSKRHRDSDKERNDTAPQLGVSSDTSKRKKYTSDKTETAHRKQTSELVSANASGTHPNKQSLENGDDPLLGRTGGIQGSTQKCCEDGCTDHLGREESQMKTSMGLNNKGTDLQSLERGLSEEESETQKGRSKLQRWSSHRDLGFGASEKLSSQEKLKKGDKHKDYNASGEKYGVHEKSSSGSHKNRQVAEIDKRPSSISEKVNGKAGVQDEKREIERRHDKVDADGLLEASVRHRDLHGCTLPHADTLAKLEKRKERFKGGKDDYEGARNLDADDPHTDREEARSERPARKRRWVSG